MDGTDSELRLAVDLYRSGRDCEAAVLCQRILDKEPANHIALHLTGLIESRRGREQAALDAFRRACQLAPTVPEYRNSYASSLGDLGRFQQSLDAFAAAVRLAPSYVPARRNTAILLERMDRFEEAAAAYERALALDPFDAGLWTCLMAVRHELGDTQGAIACRRRLVDLRPEDALLHSDLLQTLLYDPSASAADVFNEHLAWAAKHAGLPNDSWRPHANSRDPERPLRIGYVSCDFRQHPAARFFAPLVEGHDPRGFRTICYADVPRPDNATLGLRNSFERSPAAIAWRDVASLGDASLAERIRADEVDVLVDLVGHAGGRRLGMFAMKPAPVQVTGIGYAATTGLAAIDYRFTDAVCDVPEVDSQRWHVERLLRLGDCAWCYRPPADAPVPNDLPAFNTGHVTFGVFNRLTKVTPAVVETWRRILAAVPGSRLLVCAGHGRGGPSTARALCERWGLPVGRLAVTPPKPLNVYLADYHAVDVALDTFPHNGHATTCDAMWMGVPTVTLAGKAHAGRLGASVLGAVGMCHLAARSTDEYVRVATTLATDLAALRETRRGLRNVMAISCLRDEAGYAKRVEHAYRAVWRDWCADRTARAPR